ncbi:MAG: TIGR02300 family protein [Pseudomonadota bacterium]|nr:TIGR02300 family protein [Pseudomonadota bacterium]
MAQSDLGIKRICQACGARYFDLNKQPIVCPACGTPFDPEAILRSRRARVVNDDKPAVVLKTEAEAEADDGDEVDLEEEEKDEIDGDDDALLEDDDPQADIEGEGVVTVIDEGDTNN